jgi:hypothetical protein
MGTLADKPASVLIVFLVAWNQVISPPLNNRPFYALFPPLGRPVE